LKLVTEIISIFWAVSNLFFPFSSPNIEPLTQQKHSFLFLSLRAGVDLAQMTPFRSYVVVVYVTATMIFFGALHEAQPTFTYVIVSFSRSQACHCAKLMSL